MAVTMTAQAAERLREIQRTSGQPTAVLRIAVRGGGCSGLTYELSIDPEPDLSACWVFGEDDARVVVDRKSYLFVNGSQVDFTEDLMRSGFVVSNPNETRRCGCGESFAAS